MQKDIYLPDLRNTPNRNKQQQIIGQYVYENNRFNLIYGVLVKNINDIYTLKNIEKHTDGPGEQKMPTQQTKVLL